MANDHADTIFVTEREFWKECGRFRSNVPVSEPTKSKPSANNSNEPFELGACRAESSVAAQLQHHFMAGVLRKLGRGEGTPKPTKMRQLQYIMTYLQPLDALRSSQPAMSMGWSGAAVVDASGRPHTFGALPAPRVPSTVKLKACECGDTFVAFQSASDELWLFGDVSETPTETSKKEPSAICGNVAMISGKEQKLMVLTNKEEIHPVLPGLVSGKVKPVSMFPFRSARWVCMTYRETFFIIGTDNMLYKHTVGKKAASTPRRVMSLVDRGVARVHAGTGFTAIIDLNGGLWTFGKNKKGQLGVGTKQESLRNPFPHRSLSKHFFVQVSGGDCHLLALTSSGLVLGTGSNAHGQLGLGSTTEVCTFTVIPLPAACYGIAAGPLGSMFACQDGKVYSCGSNDCHQLGHSSGSRCVFVPTPIPGINKVSTFVVKKPSAEPFGGHQIAASTAEEKSSCGGCCVAM
jgi:hypothetical protein